jgi:hypothetical protein
VEESASRYAPVLPLAEANRDGQYCDAFHADYRGRLLSNWLDYGLSRRASVKVMLPDLTVAPHWPLQVANDPVVTAQDAIKALAEIRAMICRYRREDVRDWRYKHAQEAHIVNVVAGLIADATAIDKLHDAANNDATRLSDENIRLRDELAEHKRPMTAQMLMQNRRIIALTEELDKLKLAAMIRGSK